MNKEINYIDGPVYYTVIKGDTLSSIAKMFYTGVEYLYRKNIELFKRQGIKNFQEMMREENLMLNAGLCLNIY